MLREAQAGFIENRGTIDHLLTLRQIAEKYEQYGKELHVCGRYIYFRKLLTLFGAKAYGE